MNIKINNIVISNDIVQVPEFNFGQFQRLIDYEKIAYEAIIDKYVFIQKIAHFFSEFRLSEIEDDDVIGYEELIAYKNIDRPTLKNLLKHHQEILISLIQFNDYDILHLLFDVKLPESYPYLYLLQSLDTIVFREESVVLKGISIKVDRNK